MDDAQQHLDLDAILEVFNQEHESDMLARFGEKGFRIWKDAANRQRIATPDIVGTVKGSCGDTISIALTINGETIVAADFDTDGCASSQIAAATAATLAVNKTLDEAVDIADSDIIKELGLFPDADKHCTYLAAAAVREAIHRWMLRTTNADALTGQRQAPNA